MDRKSEIDIKTERLTRMLAAENLDGILLHSQHNFAWLTAGSRNGVDSSREVGISALLVRRDGRKFLLASRIEMPRMLAEEVCASEFEPIEFEWEDEKSSSAFLTDLAGSLLDGNKTLASDLALNEKTRVIETAIAGCRYELTESEIDRFRCLGRDAGEALGELARAQKPGETENEVARRTVDALAAHGISSIVTLVAADDRLRLFRHPVPTDLKWRELLMIVTCARRGGLIASLTRIVSAGAIPPDMQRRTLATARVNAQLLSATHAGRSAAELFEVARHSYASEGFEGEEKLHHQGGAAGYRPREWVIHPLARETVHTNQAFAWNPSITGTKVEETCIAFDDRVEIITASPCWPKISVEVNGREYLSPGILSL